MSNQTIPDPWDRASNPTQYSNKFWGQIHVDAWLCALVKGVGKVPFDPAQHDRPATAIDLSIIPLPEMNITNAKVTERNLIAESAEWSKIVWESLKTLGLANLREANDRWALCETVPNGRTYEKNGETREATTFKFLKLFPAEADCRADYMANGWTGQTAPQTAAQTAPAPAPATPENNSAEKSAAWQFARVIVGNVMKSSVGKPLDEVINDVGVKLAQYPGVCKFYTSQSPEVVDLMMAGVRS